jgi:uncharacterized membrane protein
MKSRRFGLYIIIEIRDWLIVKSLACHVSLVMMGLALVIMGLVQTYLHEQRKKKKKSA